jgi:hypothetical protein
LRQIFSAQKPCSWKLIDNPTKLFTVSLKLQKPHSQTESPDSPSQSKELA